MEMENNSIGEEDWQSRREVYNPDTGRNESKYPIVVDEKTGEMASKPLILGIESTTKCNLRCTMCAFHSSFRENREPGTHIPWELVEKTAEFMEEAELVPLCGGGEPLLNPDLDRMIKLAGEKNAQTVITSNGQLLTKEMSKMIITSGLTYLEVSVDGINYFEKIRGFPFSVLKKNLRGLMDLKKEMGSKTPIVDLAFTAMRDNLPELSAVVEFAAETGIRELRLQPLQVCFHQLLPQNIYLQRERTIKYISRAKKRAEEMGIKLCVRRLALFGEDDRYGDDPRSNYFFKKYHCLEPFNSILVKTDGKISVCCAGLEVGPGLGDNSLQDIWNCQDYRDLRRELISGNFRRECRECNLIHGSVENQIIMVKKPGLEDIFRFRPKPFLYYYHHLKKRGIVKGNLDALKHLSKMIRNKGLKKDRQ